jgi:hypothetical protein
MQDDVSRGAQAPTEAGEDNWNDADGDGRRTNELSGNLVTVRLTAVVLSVHRDQPVVLVTGAEPGGGGVPALPTVRFCPVEQPCLETALREAVLAAAGREIGYVDQLLTDYGPSPAETATAPGADGGETAAAGPSGDLSVSYLALARADDMPLSRTARWLRCYDLLPWEDFRNGRSPVLTQILPALEAWAGGDGEAVDRRERLHIAFGFGGRTWDDQRVEERFDLIQQSGFALPAKSSTVDVQSLRLIAAGLGRLRAKIRYRPVVFELLAPEFTLFELQRTVEAVLGPTLHKQNFRRLVEGTGLVEPTGDVRTNTGGRPAKTFRFRREVLLERAAPGVHVRPGRAA